jgi:hypothetical protein
MVRGLVWLCVAVMVGSAGVAFAEAREPTVCGPEIQGWSRARRRAEEAFRRTLRQVLAHRPGRRSTAQIERVVRTQARELAKRHVAGARAALQRRCRAARTADLPSLL